MRALETLRDAGLLVLRVSLGCLMFVGHGLGKLGSIGTDAAAQFPDPLGIGHFWSQMAAAANEGLLSLCLVLGFASRFSAFALAFTMGVAAFAVHGSDPWFGTSVTTAEGLRAMLPSRELALVYGAGFLCVGLTGPGRFALDSFVWARFRARTGSA